MSFLSKLTDTVTAPWKAFEKADPITQLAEHGKVNWNPNDSLNELYKGDHLANHLLTERDFRNTVKIAGTLAALYFGAGALGGASADAAVGGGTGVDATAAGAGSGAGAGAGAGAAGAGAGVGAAEAGAGAGAAEAGAGAGAVTTGTGSAVTTGTGSAVTTGAGATAQAGVGAGAAAQTGTGAGIGSGVSAGASGGGSLGGAGLTWKGAADIATLALTGVQLASAFSGAGQQAPPSATAPPQDQTGPTTQNVNQANANDQRFPNLGGSGDDTLFNGASGIDPFMLNLGRAKLLGQ